MKLSGIITIDRINVHAKGHGEKSKVKVTEVKINVAAIWVFPSCNSSLNLQMATKWRRRRALSISYVVRQISRSHGTKNHQFSPKFGVSGLQHRFQFTDGCRMMTRAWSSIWGVHYCFLRSCVKCQCQTGPKIAILTQIMCSPTITPVWNDWCLRNEAQAFKWHRRGLLFFKVIHQILRPCGTKNCQSLPELSIFGQ